MVDMYFYEVFEEEGVMLRRFMPSEIEAAFTWKTIQEEGGGKPGARIISVRTQSVIPVEWLSELAAILTRSTGYDHISKYLKLCRSDIPCGYLPKYCSRAVAEEAMLLWVSLFRKLRQQTEHFHTFDRDGLTGRECEGATLVVVGVGNIGCEVVRIGEGLGMRVLGVDIVKRYESVSYVTIEEGIAAADILVCAMSLTAENAGYFSYDLLKKAKRRVVFVNVARGELAPAKGLLRLVREGHLGGVGLDVYEKESELAVSLRSGMESSEDAVKAALELAKFPNVITTPHNAFNTMEAVEKKARQSVQQIEHFRSTGSFLWQVPKD